MKRLFFELRYLLGDTPWDTGVSPPELLAYLHRHPPGRALDLGCGTGTNTLALAERGWEVTAIDFSSGALRVARRRFSR
ncbi:MAG: methyltransferase domain-containing protein, partial [Anaerolineales bacterium]|nr:methyltransferase domain-containing protein [Anaerolineales bacterium]